MILLLLSLFSLSVQTHLFDHLSKARVVDHYWSLYKKFHQLSFDEAEESMRKETFLKNVLYIEAHNAIHREMTLEINKFGHLTDDEFAQMYLSPINHVARPSVDEIPWKQNITPVDWRDKHVVNPIKNQLMCGSCWAFSAVASIESANAIHNGVLFSLSEQQLVDCSISQGNRGCRGGLMDYAFDYVMKTGLISDQNYTYTAKDGECRASQFKPSARISSYVDITSGSENSLSDAIATKGPISVAIVASSKSFRFYKEGIYYEPDCDHMRLDHGVAAVGVTEQYYIVRNSWGTEWGDHGYIKMARNRNNNCGIASVASYPVV